MKFGPGIKSSLTLAALGVTLTAFVYAAVQQNYRQSANDPQIQLAEDAMANYAAGATPASLLNGPEVDMAKSLAPFVIVLDDKRNILASGATLAGQRAAGLILPPAGSFDFAKAHGQNRFTWEPMPGVREAAVIAYKGGDHPGYVLSARNLREVEAREAGLTRMVGAVLGVILLVSIVLLIIVK